MLAQQDSISVKTLDSLHIIGDSIQLKNTINILAPAKAAFYSAVLPGLGQAYNKQYWKIPIVYGAIGAGAYYYLQANNEYNRFRQAYFDRQNGLQDEFPQYTDDDVLIRAQKYYRRQRDTAMMLTILAYVLNIIDANVSAHLKQWNVNDDLSFEPVSMPIGNTQGIGLQMNIRF